jgi:cytochrome aa3-600 menaquinol oxidase subunit IV
MSGKSGSGSGMAANIIGYIISIVLVFATLYVAFKTNLSVSTIMIIIAIFAVVQAALQLFGFMHLTEGEDRDAKVVHTIYAVFMAIVVVAGSFWVVTAGHSIH